MGRMLQNSQRLCSEVDASSTQPNWRYTKTPFRISMEQTSDHPELEEARCYHPAFALMLERFDGGTTTETFEQETRRSRTS
jgi:hypothetical protein